MLAEAEVAMTCALPKVVGAGVGNVKGVCSADEELVVDDISCCRAVDSDFFALCLVLDADIPQRDSMLGAVEMAVHDQTSMVITQVVWVAHRCKSIPHSALVRLGLLKALARRVRSESRIVAVQLVASLAII